MTNPFIRFSVRKPSDANRRTISTYVATRDPRCDAPEQNHANRVELLNGKFVEFCVYGVPVDVLIKALKEAI
jgi:hypothetical protein